MEKLSRLPKILNEFSYFNRLLLSFVTPDCESLNMKAILDLQCLDGEYFLVDPSGEHKMPANGKDFCFDPTDPLGDAGDHTHHREILRTDLFFMKHERTVRSKA